MGEAPEGDDGLPGHLALLRRLVTVLTIVMICGFLVLIVALVIRLNAAPPPLPDRIALPEGVAPRAFTRGEGWYAVVTDDDRILIYNATTGALSQEVAVTAGAD